MNTAQKQIKAYLRSAFFYSAVVAVLYFFLRNLHFGYMEHLLFEFSSIFFAMTLFVLYVIAPRWKQSEGLIIFGIVLLFVSLLDVVHAVRFSGFPGTSDMPSSVTFWVLARGLQAFGLIAAATRKDILAGKKTSTTLSILLPITAGIGLFILSYVPPSGIFFIEGKGTTALKANLEILYAILFLLFAILMRHEPEAFIAGALFAFSEIAFITYVNVTDPRIILGHILKATGFLALGLFSLKKYFLMPLKEMAEVQRTYSAENQGLKSTYETLTQRWNEMIKCREKIIQCNSIDAILSLEREFFADPSKTIRLAKFEKDRLLFKNDPGLPEEKSAYLPEQFERIDMENGTTVFLDKESGFYLNIYKPFFLFIDLAKKNLLEKNQIALLNIKLVEEEKYRIDFLRSFSHELKTPLNVIYGYLQLFSTEAFGAMSAQAKTALNEMIESVKKSNEIINDLLNLAKAESGAVSVKCDRIQLKSFLNRILVEAKKNALLKNLDFVIECDGEPEISVDPKLFGLVISNLASNAVKYTDKGHVRVFARADDKTGIMIEVKDTGTGIPAEEIDAIFKPFKKGEHARGGFGLGLSLVKTYTQLIGGKVSVESQVGKGSTFRIEIPPLPKIDVSKVAKGQKADFLLIEPDKTTRDMLKILLKDSVVEEAESDEKGIVAALSTLPDMIITDFGLQRTTGDQLIKRMRTYPELADRKFLLLTGRRSSDLTLDDIPVIEKGNIDLQHLAKVLMAIRNDAIALVFCKGESEERLDRAKGIVRTQLAGRDSVEIDISEPGLSELCCLFDEAYFLTPTDSESRQKIENIIFRRKTYFSKENVVLEV